MPHAALPAAATGLPLRSAELCGLAVAPDRATVHCIRLLQGELFYFKDLRGISSVNSSLLYLAQEQKHSKKPGVRWGGLRTQHGGLGGG